MRFAGACAIAFMAACSGMQAGPMPPVPPPPPHAAPNSTALSPPAIAHPQAGRFRLQAAVPYNLYGPHGTGPDRIFVADFDGDHRADILLAYVLDPQRLAVARGSGDGTFTYTATLTVDYYRRTPHITDANGDGKLDVYVYGGASPGMGLWRGNGDGTFAAPTTVGSSDGVWTDLDGNGRDDLVIAASSGGTTPTLTVTTQLAQADGTLAAPAAAGSYPPATASVLAADFDGDGKGDLVVVETAPPQLSFFAGAGDGTFSATAESVITLAEASSCQVIADLDGDKRPDVACSPTSSTSTAGTTVIRGGATGLVAGVSLAFVASAFVDFDHDGVIDAVADGQWSRGNGDGTFGAAALRAYFGACGFGDVDGDGTVDCISSSGDVAFGGAAGALGRRTMDIGDPTDWLIADFDNDGRPDVATIDVAGAASFLQQPDGSMALHDWAPISSLLSEAAGDFDGDGNVDLVLSVRTSSPSFLIGHGDGHGGFAYASQSLPRAPFQVAVGDLDGDGTPDLAFLNLIAVTLCFNPQHDGTMQCQAPVPLPIEYQPTQIALVDIDGDGRAEIIAAAGNNGGGQEGVAISWNGWLGSAANFERVLPSGLGFSVADVDGDGHPDIVGAGATWYTTLGLRTGVLYGGPAGDLDGDGYADIYSGTALYRGGPAGATPFRTYDERRWSTARIVDMDGDGRLDIVQVGRGQPHSRLDIVRNLPAP